MKCAVCRECKSSTVFSATVTGMLVVVLLAGFFLLPTDASPADLHPEAPEVELLPEAPEVELLPEAELPDLVVDLKGPQEARAGQDITRSIVLTVFNLGDVSCSDYMVDLVLSTDMEVPLRPGEYSASFQEDVLLRGGRCSRTSVIRAGESKHYLIGAEIPSDTSRGDYYLCAVVDPYNRVRESREDNNTRCTSIYILE